MFQVTSAQMSGISKDKTNVDALVEALNKTMSRFSIDQQPRRVRYFIAQAAYETAYFTKWVEDLTYTTPARLVAVWPSRFSMTKGKLLYAPDYVNNEKKLASAVYANRSGNGDEASGDGYNFRGRGAFHLTFRSNYANASKFLFNDTSLVDDPDSVMGIENGVATAGWFWTTNSLNAQADADAFTRTTQIINGASGQALTDLVAQRMVTLNLVNKVLQW